MNLIFSYSPSLKRIRLLSRCNHNESCGIRKMINENINAHMSDEIIVELNEESEDFLKSYICS